MIQYIKAKIARIFLRKVTLALWEKDLERRENEIIERETLLTYREREIEKTVEHNDAALEEALAELAQKEADLNDAIDVNTKLVLGLWLSDEKRRLHVN